MNRLFYHKKILLLIIVMDMLLINGGFVFTFFIRYGLPFPEGNFLSYKNSFVFLTLIYVAALAAFGVYKSRFKSSWDLFKRVFSGVFLGTLISIAFVYVFRIKWGAFPTTVFGISFFVNLLLLFKFNQLILKSCRRIRKKVLVVGEGKIDEVMIKKTDIERVSVDVIKELGQHTDIDEIIICDKIPNEKDLGFITYLAQKLKIDVIFSPACYVQLLPERINGNNINHPLSTFVGRKKDIEEFFIRSLDVVGSIAILIVAMPMTILAAILIKLTSKGPIMYKQERVGKDGRNFTLYKFRTMIDDAEKQLGPVLAVENDPRVTKVGRFLRDTRIDEIPQLLNVLHGQMSLVGPRPERPYFVKRHKALMEIRLAVRPGLTGLAQVRNDYDLHPRHKIKYDYLYIQRRSLLLNLYILAKTVSVVLSRRGQ
jgi:lipopolysaccharide/colanic/teichoic acid biosynthesis glycosyltransferase